MRVIHDFNAKLDTSGTFAIGNGAAALAIRGEKQVYKFTLSREEVAKLKAALDAMKWIEERI